MPGPNDFTEEEMQVLRPLFISSVRDYLATCKAKLAAIQDGDRGADQVEALHRGLHSIKGAAFQLGVVHVGALAKAMEAVVKQARQMGRAPAPEALAPLTEGLERLEDYIAAFEDGREPVEPPADLTSRLEAAAGASPPHDGTQEAIGD